MSRFTDRIDTRFKYTPAASTDISVRIKRETKRLAEEKARKDAEAEATTIEQAIKVRALRGPK